MKLLILTLMVCLAQGLNLDQCDKTNGYEEEYICTDGDDSVYFAFRRNEYVRLICQSGDITCMNTPRFNFASGMPLRSLGVESCDPNILQCVNDIINTTSTEIVTLGNMSAALTSDDLKNLKGIKILMVSRAEAELTVPTNALKNLPTLNHLRISGGNFQLTPNAFDSLPQLKYLELSEDQIPDIPADSFNGLANLTDLNIWGNAIENIGKDSFRGLKALERLSLSAKKLKLIEDGAFSNVHTLKSLVMYGNSLVKLQNGLFTGLDKLENITVRINTFPMVLESQTFAKLPSLKNIILNYCSVANITENLFNDSTNIEKIDFSYNIIGYIHPRALINMASLKRIDFSYNRIKILEPNIFGGLKSLEYLNLKRNHIEILPAYVFSALNNLKEIYLDDNQISSISDTAFQGVSNLLVLSLSANLLTLEQEPLKYQFLDDPFPTVSPFQYLMKLKRLNLSQNKIRTLYYDWFTLMLNLEYLDLSFNKFKEVDFEQDFLSPNVTVDLSTNEISHIILPPVSYDKTNYINSTTLVLLDYNPFVCDCYIHGLRLRIDGAKSLMKEPKFDLENALCHSPKNLRGRLLSNVSPDDLVCQLPEFLPKGCSRSYAKVSTNELVIDCPKMPEILPDVTSQNLTYYFSKPPSIYMFLDKQPHTLDEKDIHTLNLSNTNLEEIYFSPNKYLKILDISNNKLKTIPKNLLESNITLYVSKNPIQCDCGNNDLLKLLFNSKNVKDFNNITCDNGKKFANLDVYNLCSARKAGYIGTGAFLLLFAMATLIFIIIRKNSDKILVFITSRGICKCCIKSLKPDADKEYDLFISFAHEDFPHIEDKLLPKLENDLKQKCCIHYRDWIVGEMITKQILDSVQNSRKTLIFLTKNFLESTWGQMEFCEAYNLALKERTSRLILILYNEDVLNHEKMSEQLNTYISTNTYLLWTDPKFWTKLKKVLPKDEHRFTWIDALKHRNVDNDDKLVKTSLDVQLNNDGKLINLAAKDNLEVYA